ncbi:hypothetical protein TNCV_2871081 [Trichonephila clavipes]|nr:hypothetical protein TNCV_2871081 [Trichonephila clavipes]
MVWTGTTLDGCMPFHVFEIGPVSAVLCRDKAYGSHKVNEFLKSEDIGLMEWPTGSQIYGPSLGQSWEGDTTRNSSPIREPSTCKQSC